MNLKSRAKRKKRRFFLFGGYRKPIKLRMVHVYFLTMMLLAICWFSVMFIDTGIYRKTTTCNDINVERDAYLCFDVNVNNYLHAEPVDCTKVIDDLDVHVLCYLKYYNIATAASIAFSFMQLIVFGIYITFAITLFCVAKWKYGNIFIGLIWAVSAILIVVVIVVIVIALDNSDDTKYETINFLYGDRVARYIICVLGCLTVVLLAGLSPYNWLIKHEPKKLLPTFDSSV